MRTTFFAFLLLIAASVAFAAEVPPAPAEQRQFVNVTGGVRVPQAVPWTPELTLMGAIKRAGGVAWREPKKVRLTRGTDRTDIEFRKIRKGEIPDPILQPGDIIELPE